MASEPPPLSFSPQSRVPLPLHTFFFLDYQQDSHHPGPSDNSTTSAMANSSGVQQTPVGTLSPPDSSSSASQSPISPTHGVRIPLAVADVPDAGLANRSPADPVKASDLKDDSDGRSRESAVPAACLACVSETVPFWVFFISFFPFRHSPTSLGEFGFIPQGQYADNPNFLDALTRDEVSEREKKRRRRKEKKRKKEKEERRGEKYEKGRRRRRSKV